MQRNPLAHFPPRIVAFPLRLFPVYETRGQLFLLNSQCLAQAFNLVGGFAHYFRR
jgi:hypothetical protein